MKLFKYMKDGGEESVVWGWWLIECKSLFSIVLLRFEDGSRDAYHSHAFNAISWVLKGRLVEENIGNKEGENIYFYAPSLIPIFTSRKRFHKVTSYGNTYVLTFRGPWSKTWKEYLPQSDEEITLTHGRKRL